MMLGKRKEALGRPLIKNAVRCLNDIDQASLYHIVCIVWTVITDRDPKGTNFPLPLELCDGFVPREIMRPPRTPRLKEQAIKTLNLEPVQTSLYLLKNMFGGINACNGCTRSRCPTIVTWVD